MRNLACAQRWAPHTILPHEAELREAAKNPNDKAVFAKYFGAPPPQTKQERSEDHGS